MPYSQRSPGSNASGVVSAAFLQLMMPGKIGGFHVLGGVGIPDVVGEAGGMGQQLAQRDRPLGRAQFRFALVVESFQDLRRRQLGKELADRLVKLELALLDELHCGGCGERLGHRRDPEHRIRGHVGALGEVALAECAFVEDAVAGRRYGDDAGDFLGVRGLAQGLIDAGERILFSTLGGAGRRRADRSQTRPQPRSRRPISRAHGDSDAFVS